MDKYLYTNRLIQEKSPYLLQHAHNPVDWFPWGEEAFKLAHVQDKPIFLSIGYATCHWCHVMEKESFENIEIAQMMNQTFINIKVDREELPEVDGLYMEFAQSMMSGTAGWPLNVLLTPDLQPFFAATYLPPHSTHGLMGLSDLILRIQELWISEEREKIMSQAEKIVEIFSGSVHAKGEELPEKELFTATAELLYKTADPLYGGMKGAPKFPIGYQSSFMLRYYMDKKDSRALFLVEKTLEMMHRGGIYDHLGGGFSRYSVDERWMVPHFEKMLYDNAILAQSYLEAWQVTKRPLYREVCMEVLDYVLREMTDPIGGFYSAEDADTEGHEGRFYTWPYDEIMKLLGEEKGHLFCAYYGVLPEGNFEGRNILHPILSLEEYASRQHRPVEELKQLFDEQRKILLKARNQRVRPFKDDKILSSWNGLMIYSLAEAGSAFQHPRYLRAAVQAARFIQENLWKGGRLLRRWREGEAMFSASLDEYAFLIKGLISLFEADCGIEWLKWALQLTAILKEDFKDPDGAFYQTDGKDPHLILRRCQFSDGAEPSGNAIHCENLLRLYQITSQEEYRSQAEDILKGVKNYLENYPPGYCYHAMNFYRYYHPDTPTLIVSLNSKEDNKDKIKQLIYEAFIPHRALIWVHQNSGLEDLLPYIREQVAIQNNTTFYVCYEGVCKKPLQDLKEIADSVQKL